MVEDLSNRLIYVGDFKGAQGSMKLISEFWREKENALVRYIVGNDATFIFQNMEDREVFARMLNEHGIKYTNQIEKQEKQKYPPKILCSQEDFDNGASRESFIKGYNSLEEVIASDKGELMALGGSFEAIGDRMAYLVNQIENILVPTRDKKRDEIYRKHGQTQDNYWNIQRGIRELIDQEIDVLYNRAVLIPGERDIELVDLISTRGFQQCPFKSCKGAVSSRDYVIRNTKTNRELWINKLTAHLATVHHLLEKGNKYGTTAMDFYQHFMTKND